MPEPAEDLWGPDFPEEHEDSAPVLLLEEQARILGRKTGGRVEGEVRQSAEGATAWISLYARVPALGGYLFKLVSFAHPVDAGPFPLKAFSALDGREQEITDMGHYKEWLHSVLSSERVRQVVTNLMRYGDRAAS